MAENVTADKVLVNVANLALDLAKARVYAEYRKTYKYKTEEEVNSYIYKETETGDKVYTLAAQEMFDMYYNEYFIVIDSKRL